MGNAHQVVINEMGQMVRGITIRLENDGIIDGSVIERDVAVEFIMNNRHAFDGHGKAHHPWLPGGLVRGSLFVSEVAAVSVVARRQLLRCLLRSHLLQSLWGAVAAIGVSRSDGLLSIILGDGFTLCLILLTIMTPNQL